MRKAMKVPVKAIACMAVLVALMAVQSALAQSKVQGVWKDVEVIRTGPNARTITDLQPSLIIYTEKHYSILWISSDKPRPELLPQYATDAQKVAAWTPFTASAGTYEVKGTTVTLHPLLEKDPMKPGSFLTMDFKFEGTTLFMTLKARETGPIANPITFKMVRVE